jgi:predicted site-specific integrase-resolvase
MVVLIVMIVTIGRVNREKYRHRGTLPHGPSAPDALRAQDDIRQLKERIAVLERVITDTHGRADLERQIEQLRDR